MAIVTLVSLTIIRQNHLKAIDAISRDHLEVWVLMTKYP